MNFWRRSALLILGFGVIYSAFFFLALQNAAFMSLVMRPIPERVSIFSSVFLALFAVLMMEIRTKIPSRKKVS